MRQADKQQIVTGTGKFRKLYRCSFDDHPTSAPHRIRDWTDEVVKEFCKLFKRKNHDNT